MENRYLRNIPALSGEECALLRGKRIAIVGCGGLGGYLVEFFARLGVGTIRCIDGDMFDDTNLNRQLLSAEMNLGAGKAKAAAERIRAVNSSVTAEVRACFLTEGNAAELIGGCDAVLDALDNIHARKILASACGTSGIPYVYGAISGWVAQAGIVLPGDGLMEKLYPNDDALVDKSALSFTPAFCAAMQASLGVKLLTEKPVETGKLFYFDLLDMEFEAIPMI